MHNVSLLKSSFDNQAPIDEESLILLKKQLIQFTIDIQTLLATSQSTELTIKYNTRDVKIFGFMRAVWRGYSLCTSGLLLQNTLFPTLRLPINAPIDKINQVISDIFNEHNLILLVKAQEQENKRLSTEVLNLQRDLETTRSDLRLAEKSKSTIKLKAPSTKQAPACGAHDMDSIHRSRSSGSIAAKPVRVQRSMSKFSLFGLLAEGLGFAPDRDTRDMSATDKEREQDRFEF